MSVLHVLLIRVASNICQGFTHYTCHGCLYHVTAELRASRVRFLHVSWLHVPCVMAALATYQSSMHHVSGSYTCQGCTYHVSWLLLPRTRALCITCQAPTRVMAARTMCHGCFYHMSGSYPARIRAACTTCTKYMNLVSNFCFERAMRSEYFYSVCTKCTSNK